MAGDYIFGVLTDLGQKEVKKWMDNKKAQKILLKCFEDHYQENKDIINVDKEVILSVDSNKIKPNKRPQEIVKSIQDIFDKCIAADDKYKAKSVELEIVYDYLKEANKELLEMCDIDEDIHIVQDEVLDNRKIMKEGHKEISDEIRSIRSGLKVHVPQPVCCFDDKLVKSRKYCFITLQVSGDRDDTFWQEVEGKTVVQKCEPYTIGGFHYVDISFCEPSNREELDPFLKWMDDFLSENGIHIFGVSTHN